MPYRPLNLPSTTPPRVRRLIDRMWDAHWLPASMPGVLTSTDRRRARVRRTMAPLSVQCDPMLPSIGRIVGLLMPAFAAPLLQAEHLGRTFHGWPPLCSSWIALAFVVARAVAAPPLADAADIEAEGQQRVGSGYCPAADERQVHGGNPADEAAELCFRGAARANTVICVTCVGVRPRRAGWSPCSEQPLDLRATQR